MQKHIKNWWDKNINKQIAFYSYLVIVFVFTLTPVNKLKPSFLDGFLFKGADKFVHVSIFIGMAFFYYSAFKFKPLKGFVILVLIGLLIEILQSSLNLGRSFEWMDLVADGMGVLVYLFIYYLFKQVKT